LKFCKTIAEDYENKPAGKVLKDPKNNFPLQ